jgi:hypothetical protein
MTTQNSTQLAALGAALLINALMLGSVAVLFGAQTHLGIPARALVHTTSAAPIAAAQAQVRV